MCTVVRVLEGHMVASINGFFFTCRHKGCSPAHQILFFLRRHTCAQLVLLFHKEVHLFRTGQARNAQYNSS
ncbi:hypothetical protein DUNSADRAFT_10457 [Dunaliella salina]|uniref:Encoded protein n=1 Tax=Dunaliella salina TaxID=3046 RepID=A0ABQ7GFB5_DUNSA|nr:hypothetical protein DUNSADRAFT_10457 [Dunaliella salina]|eukprot:KAF5833292.1 hypothetical protein DUNSADRAFT_10457 [Dunaliella salina]